MLVTFGYNIVLYPKVLLSLLYRKIKTSTVSNQPKTYKTMKNLKDVILTASAKATQTAITELFRKEIANKGGSSFKMFGKIKPGSGFSFLDLTELEIMFIYKNMQVLCVFSKNGGQWCVNTPKVPGGLYAETCQAFDAMFKKLDKVEKKLCK